MGRAGEKSEEDVGKVLYAGSILIGPKAYVYFIPVFRILPRLH
jgi:hypothetical protein